jgi:hypothetical protein
MAGRTRSSFVKRQRERDQKQRRKLKAERRMLRRTGNLPGSPDSGDAAPESVPGAIDILVKPEPPPAESRGDTP